MVAPWPGRGLGGWHVLCALAHVLLGASAQTRTCASHSGPSERHVMRTQIAPEDTINGVAHRGSLLQLFERAAVEMLGRPHLGELFAEEGLLLGAESVDVVEYGVYARVGDRLEVSMTVIGVDSKGRLWLTAAISRASDQRMVCACAQLGVRFRQETRRGGGRAVPWPAGLGAYRKGTGGDSESCCACLL